jgi:hypothetical protein
LYLCSRWDGRKIEIITEAGRYRVESGHPKGLLKAPLWVDAVEKGLVIFSEQ